jgi:hypothetical protein
VHPTAPPAFSRVTVLTPDRRVDVALPTDVVLAELVPMVLELLGEPLRSPDRPDPWRFTGTTGGLLPSGATLDELGVLDGEMLRLGPASPPPPAPVFDDPVDALAALAPHRRRDRRWPATAAVGVTLAAAALLATVRSGGAGGPQVAAASWLGGIGAVAALAYAGWVARRHGRSGVEPDADAEPGGVLEDDVPEDEDAAGDLGADRLAALVAACCAVPLAGAAGWAAFPGPPDATHLLIAAVAAGTAAAVGQVALRAVAPLLIAAVVLAVVTGTAAVVGLRFGVAAPALSAAAAAVALCAGPLLPRAVLRLAGLPRPVVPADARDLVSADAGPDLLSPAELAERARVARGQLAGLSGGFAVAAAVAVLPAAAPGGWAGTALAAVAVVTLLLRARGFADVGPSRVHLVAGIAAGVALVVLGAAASGPAGRPVGALVLIGAAALGVQALDGAPPGLSPVARRAVDIAEGALTAIAVPLALAAAGVFALVRGL